MACPEEVFVITDACGDVSTEAHERAVDRMVAAGAQPITSVQYLLELQCDWTRTETYDLTLDIARQFGGAYGLAVIYVDPAGIPVGQDVRDVGDVVEKFTGDPPGCRG